MRQQLRQIILAVADRVTMEILGHSYRWLRWQRQRVEQ